MKPITRKPKTYLGFVVASLLVSISAFVAGADDASPEPTREVVEDYDETTKALQDYLQAPDACQYENLADGAMTDDLEMIPGSTNFCGKGSLYGFVCDYNRQNKRFKNQDSSNLAYDVVELVAVLKAWPSGDEHKQSRELFADAVNEFSEKVRVYHQSGGERPHFDLPEATKVVYQGLIGDRNVRKAVFQEPLMTKQYDIAKSTFAMLKDGMTKYLDEQHRSAKWNLEDRFKNDPRYKNLNRDLHEDFVDESFILLKQMIARTVLDSQAAPELCMRNQQNVFTVREPGRPNRIIICPGALLPDASAKVGQIAGSLAKALAHSIDSCALDFVGVGKGKDEGDEPVRLSGLLEPLRSCLGEKVKPNALPGNLQKVPVPHGKAYDITVQESLKRASHFATMGWPAQHCAKPMTAADLANPSEQVKQRDQSNDAVAQFFANKALVNALPSIKGLDTSGQKRGAIYTEAFAPACNAVQSAKGSHVPPEIMFDRIMKNDPDLRRLMCGPKRNRQTEKLKAQIRKDKLNYFKQMDPKMPDLVDRAACDGSFVGGVAKYIPGISDLVVAGYTFPRARDPEASNFTLNIAAHPAVEPPKDIEVEPGVTDPPPADALAGGGEPLPAGEAPVIVGDQAPGEQPEIDMSDDVNARVYDLEGMFPDSVARQDYVNEFSVYRDRVYQVLQKDCYATIEGVSGFPPHEQVIADQCNADVVAQSTGRTEIGMWQEPVTVDGAVAKSDDAIPGVTFDCRARCDCNRGQCFMPELVYLGATHTFKPTGNRELVKADIKFLTDHDDSIGRHGIAHKKCFERFMPQKVDLSSCSDSSGVVKISDPNAKLEFVGELSGSVIPLTCSFECGCDGSQCIAGVAMPDLSDSKTVLRMATPDELSKLPTQHALGEQSLAPFLLNQIPGVAPAQPKADAPSEQAPEAPQGESPPAPPTPVAPPRGTEPSAGLVPTERQRNVGDFRFAYLDSSQMPQPTQEYVNRNKLREIAAKEALDQCKALASNMTQQALRSGPVYRQSRTNFVFGPDRVKTKQLEVGSGGKKYNFEFQCVYHSQATGKSCETDRLSCVNVAYAGPKGEKVFSERGELYRPLEGWMADWMVLKPTADYACKLRKPKGNDFAVTSHVCTGQDVGNPDTDAEIYMTGLAGDLTGARLPYHCQYKCDCTNKTCVGQGAMPLKLVNVESYGADQNGYQAYEQSVLDLRAAQDAAKKRARASSPVKPSNIINLGESPSTDSDLSVLCDSENFNNAQNLQTKMSLEAFSTAFAACHSNGVWSSTKTPGDLAYQWKATFTYNGQEGYRLFCGYTCKCGGPELDGKNISEVKGHMPCRFKPAKSKVQL